MRRRCGRVSESVSADWTLEVFEADDETFPFERFVARELSAFQRQELDEALRLRLARDGIDLARS